VPAIKVKRRGLRRAVRKPLRQLRLRNSGQAGVLLYPVQRPI